MKTLEQIQQENRKMILEAIHGCSYEEALEKELGFGCEILSKTYNHKITIGKLYESEKDTIKELYHIIGKPLTLDRVLLAICQTRYYDDIYLNEETKTLEFDYKDLSLSFVKPTLEEQSEETQRAFHKFMGGEND